MPLSPVASRENLRKRGNSKPNAVVADNLRLVGEPGVSHRPLTLLEARDLALRQPPSVNRSEFRPSTLKKNRQFLKRSTPTSTAARAWTSPASASFSRRS